MNPYYVFLNVAGKTVPLGAVHVEPGELPELLRHVADYYDDNPDVCAQLFALPAGSKPPYLGSPFRPCLDEEMFSAS